MLMFYLGVVSPLLVLTHTKQLQRRWSRCNAELPLLALLPGLGDSAQARRALLRASLLPMLGLQTLLLLATMVLLGYLHLTRGGDALLLLSQLAGMALLVAFDLTVLGNVAIGLGWTTVLLGSGYLLVNASCVVALPLFDGHALVARTGVLTAMALLWASLLTPLVIVGHRGWRGLQRRPHPFLANV